MGRSGSKSRRAFTLMELIVTTTIVSIVSVTAAPFFINTVAQRLNTATHDLAIHLKLARDMAVAMQRTTWVDFDTGLDTYTVYIENPANPGRGHRLYATHPTDGGNFIVSLGTGTYDRVSISSASFRGRSEVEFNGSGAPGNGTGQPLTSDGSVTLAGGDNTRTIYVVVGTGYVREH